MNSDGEEQLSKNSKFTLIKCGTFDIIRVELSERSSAMAGHGRPPVENPKTVKVGFRVSEAERDRLLAYCEKMKLTQSQVLKEALELLYKTKP